MYRVTPLDTSNWPLLKRAFHKIYRYSYRDPKRRKILESIVNTSPSPPVDNAIPFSVHTLICKKDLLMGICSAKSLNLASEMAFPWIFHDDGSLSLEDQNLLKYHFPETKVIPRQESDELVSKELAVFPNFNEWRKKQPYMLKILDVLTHTKGNKILFTDTDVLFFKKPSYMIEQATHMGSIINIFNKDISTNYTLDSISINNIINCPVKEKINVGLWIMNKEDIKIAKIEEWLKTMPTNLPALKLRLMEQTLLAMLASTSLHGVNYLPHIYDVEYEKPVKDAICKHYVGKIRHGFELEGLKFLIKELNFFDRWSKFANASNR